MKYRFIYDSEKIILIARNDGSTTYTANNVLVATVDEAVNYFTFLGLDLSTLHNMLGNV